MTTRPLTTNPLRDPLSEPTTMLEEAWKLGTDSATRLVEMEMPGCVVTADIDRDGLAEADCEACSRWRKNCQRPHD